MDILLLHRYNIIPPSPHLHHLNQNTFQQATHLLIQHLPQYQPYTPYPLILLFHPHILKPIQNNPTNHPLDLIFTTHNQTPHHPIQNLPHHFNNIPTQI
ncbi:NYN domain-containing protein, partial [Bacillus sp. WP8]|uniref:NYN domain-containing protein n=1 Tax=Bacillus sp. WP8 TaxID=756828 RepID=UPI0037C07DFC